MIGVIALCGPGVAIGREDAIAIIIVEQNVLLRQGVMVGRNKLRVNAEAGIAVSLWKIAENLVVGFVFLQNVKDMLENGRLSGSQGHRHMQSADLSWLLRLPDLADTTVLVHLGGEFAQRLCCRDRNLVSRAQMSADLPGCICRLPIPAAEAFNISHINII